jgi:DNA-binding response OmpR family regulator
MRLPLVVDGNLQDFHMLFKILLLENCRDMESMITMVLEEDGFIVSTTIYTKILKDAFIIKPHLVILSPRMRERTEISLLCRNLRSQQTNFILPIIFLSG